MRSMTTAWRWRRRSLAGGRAGVDNRLFSKENNRTLVGDAKKALDEVRVASRA